MIHIISYIATFFQHEFLTLQSTKATEFIKKNISISRNPQDLHYTHKTTNIHLYQYLKEFFSVK